MERHPPALRQRIGRHVLLSLVLIWGLGSAVVLAVGNHFVAEPLTVRCWMMPTHWPPMCAVGRPAITWASI